MTSLPPALDEESNWWTRRRRPFARFVVTRMVVIDCDGLGDGGIAPDVGQGGEFGVVV